MLQMKERRLGGEPILGGSKLNVTGVRYKGRLLREFHCTVIASFHDTKINFSYNNCFLSLSANRVTMHSVVKNNQFFFAQNSAKEKRIVQNNTL